MKTGRVHDQGHVVDQSVHWHELAHELAPSGSRRTTRKVDELTCTVCVEAVWEKQTGGAPGSLRDALAAAAELRERIVVGTVSGYELRWADKDSPLTPAAGSGVEPLKRAGGDSRGKSDKRAKTGG